MLFENRRILIGFRIRITFDPSIQKEDFYLFIDTSKIHTVKDLLADVKSRFQIKEDLLPLLNDCRVLQTEDILVLVEASELKLIPVTKNISVGESPHANVTCKRIEVSPTTVEDAETTNSEPKPPPPLPEIRPKFSKSYNYGSVAETIRFLSQVDETSKSSVELHNGQPAVDNFGADSSSVREEELNSDFEKDCFSDITVEKPQKRKRKRKRKHSKKRNVVNGDEISKPFSADSDNTVQKSLTPRVPSRSHIFFADATEETLNKEHSSIDEPDAMDIENEIPAYEVTNLTDKHRGNLRNGEKEPTPVSSNAVQSDSECTGTDYDSEHTDTSSTYKTIPNRIPLRETTSNADKSATTIKRNPTERTTSNSDKAETRIKVNFTERNGLPNRIPQREPTQKPSSNFFTAIKANTGSQSNSSEDANVALSTLLMCKQLKTHLEYYVQFAQSPTINQSPKSETPNKSPTTLSQSLKPEIQSKLSTTLGQSPTPEAQNRVSVAASVKKETQEDKNVAEKLIEDDDECKVLNPYLLNGNVIRVRDGNFWVVLTADLASKKFSLVANPKEGTTITFQLLLLGSDMCPTMTSLILGQIVLFNKEYKKVAMKISPAFMEPIVKEFGNEGALPEDIVWVESNVYELDWFSLRNPRLMM